MKTFDFLFDNFQMFILVWVAVGLNTIAGVVSACIRKTFSWDLLTLWVKKTATFTVMMMFANVVEHFVALGGHHIDGYGLIPIASTYLLQQLNSLKENLNTIWKNPETI